MAATAGPGNAQSNWKNDMVNALQQRASALLQVDVTAQVHTRDKSGQALSNDSPCSSNTGLNGVSKVSQKSVTSPQQYALSEFEAGRIIGAGSFGRVRIAQHKPTATPYVIKSLSKAACIKDGQVRHVIDEKAMLVRVSAASHPFLVNLKAAFQDATCLHLVLDYVPGGEFFSFLRDYPARFGCKMKEDHARFYTAQVILALEHLHVQGIAFRDLKPENMLMGADGYIRVTDFGFAKEVGHATYTMCGTPDYLAPEVIRAQGHTTAVDWWSLGCVVYEMLYGFPPFYANGDATQTYQKTLARQLALPRHWSDLAKSVIDGLLQLNPNERLGVAGGIEKLKSHPWFQGLDWKLILAKRYQPPYRPRLSSADDTSNFDDYSKLAPVVHPFPLTPAQQKMFAGF